MHQKNYVLRVYSEMNVCGQSNKNMTKTTNKPIRLLLSTDSPTIHTGLAETTRLVFNRLLEKYPDKYHIEQIGWFHTNQGPEKATWKVHPTQFKDGKFVHQDKYGQMSFERILNEVKPDIVYSNGDLWCFDHILNSQARNSFRFVAYYTVDGAPYWGNDFKPGKYTEWGTKLSKADEIIVLTEFGRETLVESMPEMKGRKIEVIYHPVDANRFKSLNKEEKLEVREKMYGPGIPHKDFVLGWIGRNQFRKQNYKMWETMHHLIYGDYIKCSDCERITRMEWDRAKCETREIGRLRLYEPDYDYSTCWYCRSSNVLQGTPHNDIWLWNHMNKQDPGWRVDDHTAMWEIKDRMIYTPGLTAAKGLPPQQLADLIATWDGLLYLSGGEGFGIPAFEAMLSGVPVIYSNYSSHADFAKYGGLSVRCDMIPELNFGINRAYVDVNHAIERVLWGYYHQEDFRELGIKGKKYAETKTLDSIVEQWDRVFTQMMTKPVGTGSTELIYADRI